MERLEQERQNKSASCSAKKSKINKTYIAIQSIRCCGQLNTSVRDERRLGRSWLGWIIAKTRAKGVLTRRIAVLRGRLASRAIVRSRASRGAHVAGGLGLTRVLIVRLTCTVGTRTTRHVGQVRGVGFLEGLRISGMFEETR